MGSSHHCRAKEAQALKEGLKTESFLKSLDSRSQKCSERVADKGSSRQRFQVTLAIVMLYVQL